MRILVTGATGFLGSELLELLKNTDHKLICLSRSKRVSTKNVVFLNCSIDSEEDLRKIENKIEGCDVLVHMAGLYDLSKSYSEHYQANVIGTMNVVKMANKSNSIKRFIHISSIGVCGDYEGNFRDVDFDKKQTFSSAYEKTKFLSEKVVREQLVKDIQTIILRPGILTASANTKRVKRDGPYQVFDSLHKIKSFLSKSLILPLPYDSFTTLPLVSVDYVANQISKAIIDCKDNKNIECRFLIPKRTPKVKTILNLMLKELGFQGLIIPIKNNVFITEISSKIGLSSDLVKYCYSKTRYCHSSEEHLFDFDSYEEEFISSLKKIGVKK